MPLPRPGFALVAAACLLLATEARAKEPACSRPQLGEEQVKQLIVAERARRPELPPAFPRAEWRVRRQGCHTIASESPVPPVPDGSRLFWLNQHGVLVDFQLGNAIGSPLVCPGKPLAEPELARVVREARAAREELPPPFEHSRIRVDRMRCSHLYFEYRVPESPGDFQTFVIDALGELMEVQRSKPY